MSISGDGKQTKLFIDNIANVQGTFPGKIGSYTLNIVYQEALL
jgi:hypothetical protein